MAQIKADEISKIIREQIEDYRAGVEVSEIGSVISVGDGIARVYGLDKVMAGELLSFPHDLAGIAMNLEEDQVGVVLLGEYTEISEGDQVKRTGRIMSVPVGDGMIGRVVNALGQPIDGKKARSFPGKSVPLNVIARCYRPSAGKGAPPDRTEGHRQHDSDRPRPARVDHRRPPDGQDCSRHRCDHQPKKGHRRLICIYVAIGQKRSTVALKS